MRTVVIIQARMGATRLPGKVLRPLVGRSVLSHVVERVSTLHAVSAVVVATTLSSSDDAVAAECGRLGAVCFRGSEPDVLSRYHGAARMADADVIVRVTADCPLFDRSLLESMLQAFVRESHHRIDYLSNTLKRTYPRGLDAEIFNFASLDRAFSEAAQPHEREHVTPFIYEHPEFFRLHSFESETDRSNLRWTLDTPEDLQLIEEIYGALYKEGEIVATKQVLQLLKERPELIMLNAHVEQKKLTDEASGPISRAT